MESELIPIAVSGKNIDLECKCTYPDTLTASKAFDKASRRLLSPSKWNSLVGDLSANFTVFNADGNCAGNDIREKDFLRIDIPGPGSSAGKGYDWVQIAKIDRDSGNSSIGLQLIASPAPQADTDAEAAHFFKTGASSTFIIQRNNLSIIASYHGRNEKANIKTGSVVDNIRNALVAFGAVIGVSEIQWKKLLEGFLIDSEEDADKNS